MTTSKATALLQAADALETLGKALRVLSGEVIEFAGRTAKWPERKEEAPKAESTPGEVEAAPEPEPDAPTLEQVRSVLAKLSRKGATDEVRDLLADLGCSKLSEVPAEKYSEVLERAKGIQRSYR